MLLGACRAALVVCDALALLDAIGITKTRIALSQLAIDVRALGGLAELVVLLEEERWHSKYSCESFANRFALGSIVGFDRLAVIFDSLHVRRRE